MTTQPTQHISKLVRDAVSRRCPPFAHFTIGPVHVCDTGFRGSAHASCSTCGWTFGGIQGEPIEVVYEYASHHIGQQHDRRRTERRGAVPASPRPTSAS